MNDSPWTTDEQRLLADLLTGSRSLDDPEVARAVAANPALADEFRELQQIAAHLDVAGSGQRDDVTDVLSVPPQVEDMARGLRLLRELPLPQRRRPWWPLMLAASLLVLGGLAYAWWPAGTRVADGDTHLGTLNEVSDMVPNATNNDLSEFSWKSTLNELTTEYVVHILDEAGIEFLSEPGIEGTSWKPTREQVTSMERHASISWYLECGSSGVPLFSDPVFVPVQRR